MTDEELLKEKESYYSLYNKELVDKAFEYLRDSENDDAIKLGLMAELALMAAESKECNGAERAKIMGEKLYDTFQSTFIFAFLHGATEGVKMNLKDTFPRLEDTMSEYRKNKDFCVFFNFGDNDFGDYIEKGAQAYADKYNGILRNIDLYKDNKDWDENKSLYVKDLAEMEQIATIQKIIACEVMSSIIKSREEDILSSNIKSREEDTLNSRAGIKDFIEDAYYDMDYLNITDESRYRIGTYEEVEKWVVENNLNNQDKPKEKLNLKNIWINGEAIVMAVINGKMEVWIR